MVQPGPPVRVLYVGGVPRSGSTLADLMIGQLPAHVGVGELYYLWQNGPRQNVTCACGERFTDCPFWTEVGARAYGGWSAAPVDEVLALQRRVDRTARIPRLIAPTGSFGTAARRYTEILTALYRGIADTAGATVVVDSSKRPSLGFALRRAPGVRLGIAHVVRDPRGVAYSWSKTVKLPAGASHRTEMPRWSTGTVARRWVTVNASIAALARLGVPRVVVRYEDLVRDPATELIRVAALHDVAVRPDELDFLSDGGVRPAASHTIAGSRIRLSTGVMTLRVDEEWRRSLPPGRRRFVAAATAMSRWRYGYR